MGKVGNERGLKLFHDVIPRENIPHKLCHSASHATCHSANLFRLLPSSQSMFEVMLRTSDHEV